MWMSKQCSHLKADETQHLLVGVGSAVHYCYQHYFSNGTALVFWKGFNWFKKKSPVHLPGASCPFCSFSHRERMKVKQELPWGQFASCAGEMPLDLFISLFIPQQKDSTKTVSEAYVKQNRVPVVSYVQYQTQNSMVCSVLFIIFLNIILKVFWWFHLFLVVCVYVCAPSTCLSVGIRCACHALIYFP